MFSNLYTQTPNVLNYQGKLIENGTPVSGKYSLSFSIYSQLEGGTLLWSEVQNVDVVEGIFNVLLGNVNSLPDNLFTDSGDRFLGINVDNNSEMTPRFRLTGVPYAVRATTADAVPDSSITSEKIAKEQIIRSINSMHDNITISAGPNISITEDENTIKISADANALPKGIILLWSGTVESIPSGWALCNGANGTPDLRGMFIRGAANTINVGEKGGTQSHTHNTGTYAVANHTHGAGSYVAAVHTHDAGSLSAAAHTHGAGSYGLDSDGSGGANTSYGVSINGGKLCFDTGVSYNKPQAKSNITGTSGSGGGALSGTTASGGGGAITGTSGSGGSGNITGQSGDTNSLPPYYTLAFIMKL